MFAGIFRAAYRLLIWSGVTYTITGRTGKGPYLTRTFLTPMTRWGCVYLHCFHRGDTDRDPHDHPFRFWTYPLNQGYTEDVFRPAEQCFTRAHVSKGKWTFRPAQHCHRVTDVDSGTFPLWTIVIRGPKVRGWGFWVYKSLVSGEVRKLLPWRKYGDWDDQTNGREDEHCA